ncbi:hypothetical protein HY29_10910 [Hyphomonas beringensis]|uniref:HTH arsR-type domain-containing protein n=1 Tax=Hyphomonas beringensis TaxID=1280946 RepID=A0A062UBF1_9PROT|nr:metalloregulator ArsR/SmtB family transcription factor [Hyphomonas beringensis]KCZ55627.1 hypothetical protein HY29_10910 [Hyphomonas beringensis]
MSAPAAPSDTDAVFQALGDATRRAILERLSRRPASISDIAAPFDMSLAAVVQHVQVLERSGLVRSNKIGRVRTCEINPQGLALARQWLDERRQLWEDRFHRLAEFLDEEEDGGGD